MSENDNNSLDFLLKKPNYSQDIVYGRDRTIFCTANEHFCFVRGGVVDVAETKMMRVRWKSFQFFTHICEEEQRVVPSQ